MAEILFNDSRYTTEGISRWLDLILESGVLKRHIAKAWPTFTYDIRKGGPELVGTGRWDGHQKITAQWALLIGDAVQLVSLTRETFDHEPQKTQAADYVLAHMTHLPLKPLSEQE